MISMNRIFVCDCVVTSSHARLNSEGEAAHTHVCVCVSIKLRVSVIQWQLRRVRCVGAPAHLISSLQGSLAILHHCAEHDVWVLDHQALHSLLIHLENRKGEKIKIKSVQIIVTTIRASISDIRKVSEQMSEMIHHTHSVFLNLTIAKSPFLCHPLTNHRRAHYESHYM